MNMPPPRRKGFNVISNPPATSTGPPRPRQTQHTPADLSRAVQLLDRIRTTRVIPTKGASAAAWAVAFTKLRTVDGIPDEMIDKVLAWYLPQIQAGDMGYTPQAFSGKAFRAKWVQIVLARDRHTREAVPDYTQIVITPGAAHTAMYLERWSDWPPYVRPQIPAAVQIAYDTLRDLRGRLLALRAVVGEDRKHPQRSLSNLAGRILELIDPPNAFIDGWYRRVHDEETRWLARRGDLLQFAFVIRPGNEYVMRWGMLAADAYAGDGPRWGLLVAALYPEFQ